MPFLQLLEVGEYLGSWIALQNNIKGSQKSPLVEISDHFHAIVTDFFAFIYWKHCLLAENSALMHGETCRFDVILPFLQLQNVTEYFELSNTLPNVIKESQNGALVWFPGYFDAIANDIFASFY